jgi:hypothetical protein
LAAQTVRATLQLALLLLPFGFQVIVSIIVAFLLQVCSGHCLAIVLGCIRSSPIVVVGLTGAAILQDLRIVTRWQGLHRNLAAIQVFANLTVWKDLDLLFILIAVRCFLVDVVSDYLEVELLVFGRSISSLTIRVPGVDWKGYVLIDAAG